MVIPKAGLGGRRLPVPLLERVVLRHQSLPMNEKAGEEKSLERRADQLPARRRALEGFGGNAECLGGLGEAPAQLVPNLFELFACHLSSVSR